MAAESANWIFQQGGRPDLILTTDTARTRQTADEVCAVFPQAPCRTRLDVPELEPDWDRLMEDLEIEIGRAGTAILVGHQPTLWMLLSSHGPAPVPIPRASYATVLTLQISRPGPTRITAAWPGRVG